MKMTFNTGRGYSALGQVITAETREGKTLFKDHSRLICGEIDGVPPLQGSMPEWVMDHYDHNRYRMNMEAAALEQSDTIRNVRISR